jgi:ATP-dependent HslUV protease subunit HslV
MQNIMTAAADPIEWHGTFISFVRMGIPFVRMGILLVRRGIPCVRRCPHVAMAGNGRVSLGQTVVKGSARKVRRIGAGSAMLSGFAGAIPLLERLAAKLERFPSPLERACEAAKASRATWSRSV